MFWRRPLFRKPVWLKPELEYPVYYLHLLILAVVVFGILQYVFGQPDMLTIKNVLISIPLLTISDGIAHSLLKLN